VYSKIKMKAFFSSSAMKSPRGSKNDMPSAEEISMLQNPENEHESRF
jgi:hypothetical protein